MRLTALFRVMLMVMNGSLMGTASFPSGCGSCSMRCTAISFIMAVCSTHQNSLEAHKMQAECRQLPGTGAPKILQNVLTLWKQVLNIKRYTELTTLILR